MFRTYVFASLLLFSATSALAAGESFRHETLTCGGGVSSNASMRVYDVVGQAVIGDMTSGNHRLISGYVPVAQDYLTDTPTAVAIAAFDARFEIDRVEITWEIASSNALIGFELYRSDAGAPFRRITAQPLAGYRYTDRAVVPGTAYSYRLGAIDTDGEFFSMPVDVTIPVRATRLLDNYPNPFNPVTVIPFYLERAATVSLVIYDASGALVRTLVNDSMPFGRHDVDWDGRDDTGRTVASGVYFYRLTTAAFSESKKLLLLK